MGGSEINPISSPANMPSPVKTLDETVLQELQGPAENRFERLKEVFDELSPSDAKALYDRLRTNSEKDPVAAKFNSTLKGTDAGSLMGILHSKFIETEAKAPIPKQESRVADSGVADARKGEIGMQGSIRASELHGQLLTAEAKKIAGNDSLKPEEKRAKLESLMTSASKDEFRQLMQDAQKWPDKAQGAMAAAMALSETVMARVGKDLSPKEQVSAHEFLMGMETGEGEDEKVINDKMNKATDAWLKNTGPEALNAVMQGSTNNFHVADRIMSLPPDARSGLIGQLSSKNSEYLIHNAIASQKEIPKDWERPLTQAFSRMDPAQKNSIIDRFQNEGKMPKFLAAMGGFNDYALKGLNRENAKFIQETYEHLAKSAEMRKDVEGSIHFSEQALHLKGWIENNFRK